MKRTRAQLAEQGRRGAAVRWAKHRAARKPLEPFQGTILDAMEAAGLTGESWATWRVLVKAARGVSLDAPEREVFTRHTARREPPARPVRHVYAICGRRAGKTRVASVLALWVACSRDYRAVLAPGETAIVPLLAADKRQARQALDYVRGLSRMSTFAPYVARTLRDSIELRTGCTLEVKTASYRLVRGFTVPAIVADELAFWWQGSDSANPDTEVIAALVPAMATMPDAQLWGRRWRRSCIGSGWRRNETLTREWRHIDWDRGTICLEPLETKSGKGRELPFAALPELEAVLKAQRAYTDAVEKRTGAVVRWVFHREGDRVVSIRQAWRTACKKAGLIGYRPHDFRRSTVRRLEQAGISRSVAMKIVGHQSEAIYHRYSITNDADVREALQKVAAMPKRLTRRLGSA